MNVNLKQNINMKREQQQDLSITEIESQLKQFQEKYEVLLREIDTNRQSQIDG